jgi:UDP-galactopyranose mutase
MWGVELEELDPTISGRVNIRDDMNDDYFPSDTFQALPNAGYTEMVKEMLSHKNITVELSTPFRKKMENSFAHTFNSMAIDEYFDYKFGPLPYRSIKFHQYTIPVPNLFPTAVVNFTHSEPFTRVTEWKNLPGHGENPGWTTISIEEPCNYEDNHFERYYPIKDLPGNNRILHERYRAEVPENMTFIGRCGLYAYLDMHQAISSSMAFARRYLRGEREPQL